MMQYFANWQICKLFTLERYSFSCAHLQNLDFQVVTLSSCYSESKSI